MQIISPGAKNTDVEEKLDDYDNSSLAPFIFGTANVLAQIDERIKYGKTLINSRFRVPYVPTSENISPEDDYYSYAGNQLPDRF